MKEIDVAVLVVYLIAVVALGCWFVRRSRTTEGFMAAGRSLPGWAVGLSIFGTYLSSNTFIGLPGKAYDSNWNRLAFSLAIPIAAVIAVRFFVPFYRRSREISAYHHLEKRFGTWARTVAAICYLLTQIARTGSIMLGVAYGLNALLGWPVATIIVMTGILVTLYTLLGGIEAVIWTDVVQSIILTVGAVVVGAMLVVNVPGGPGQIFAAADSGGSKLSLGSFGSSLTEETFWVVFLFGVVTNLNNFGIDQSFVQRYHTARSGRAAARSVWLAALLYLPISAGFLFIGTSLFVYYEKDRDMLADVRAGVAAEKLAAEGVAPDVAGYEAKLAQAAKELEAKDISDKVLPHFIVHKLPPGVAGLLIAAIFAAAMSSIDTSLNSSATITLADIYKRYVRPHAGERESMRVLRASTVAWGALGTTVALALIGVKSVLDAWWILSGLFVAGMLGLFLLGLIARRADKPAAVAAVVLGSIVIAWMTASIFKPWPGRLEQIRSPLSQMLIPTVGTMTIVLAGTLIGYLRASPRNRSKPHEPPPSLTPDAP
ncbi:MAG: sodium:solute symporter family protein [Planctomycetota bacterium]